MDPDPAKKTVPYLNFEDFFIKITGIRACEKITSSKVP
jgi:hypothetical protein